MVSVVAIAQPGNTAASEKNRHGSSIHIEDFGNDHITVISLFNLKDQIIIDHYYVIVHDTVRFCKNSTS